MVSLGTYQVATLFWHPWTEYIRGVVVNHVKSEQKVARCLVSDDKGRTQLRFLSSDGNEDPMVVGRTLCSAGGGGSVDWCTGGGSGGGHGAPLLAKQHQRC